MGNIHDNGENGGIFGSQDHAFWLWAGISTLDGIH